MTDAWGIDDGYVDAAGHWHETDAATVAALRDAMRGGDGAVPDVQPVHVMRRDEPSVVSGPALLTLEDGTELAIEHGLPPDLPLGYHDLRPLDGDADTSTRLIVSPGRCHLPEGLRAWGAAVQLYAARSERSWGMGDLGDLRTLAEWTRERGAGVLAVNPLHAATPISPVEPSPYFPSTRRWSNPLYLRIEDVPGAADEPGVGDLAAAGRSLNGERRIDRDAVHALKFAALDRLWQRFPGDSAFDEFMAEHQTDLTEFATFCVLAEHHGTGWRRWPTEHRSPASGAVAAFATHNSDRVRFHAWLQWLIDRQLVAAGADDLLIADLAV
ncbi:MAG: 4-alpha-glucanotransferase, partial [Actinomycetota bacterium]|nr:4-alpha-glucanotransferase [Actinomycetota bacterium]